MNQPQLATCQCIIAHPSKPKFLAVKHTDGHLPPTVKIPLEFNIGQNIEYVLDGVRRKYGLQTVALRHLARFSDYQCIELEMLGKDARRLQAVWVGLDDYRRIRGADKGGFDPLRAWLEEQGRGVAPLQRPPWERPGWFKKASHWIDFQLDRLNIQRAGPAVQQRALMHAGAVLRVPTAGGKLFVLAARNRPPREVALMRFLKERWPERVTTVLADDAARNWMLVPDPGAEGRFPQSPDDLATAVDALARMQVESVPLAPRLRDLGCHPAGLSDLRAFLARDDLPADVAALNATGLTEAERLELTQLLPRLADACERLAEVALPPMLVHPDFRVANCVLGDSSMRFLNWADSLVGHPFMSLIRLLQRDYPEALEAPQRDPVVSAYLSNFEGLQTRARLLEALRLAWRLFPAWTLMQWSRELSLLEPGGVSRAIVQDTWVAVARQLLAGQRVDAGQILAE